MERDIRDLELDGWSLRDSDDPAETGELRAAMGYRRASRVARPRRVSAQR